MLKFVAWSTVFFSVAMAPLLMAGTIMCFKEEGPFGLRCFYAGPYLLFLPLGLLVACVRLVVLLQRSTDGRW